MYTVGRLGDKEQTVPSMRSSGSTRQRTGMQLTYEYKIRRAVHHLLQLLGAVHEGPVLLAGAPPAVCRCAAGEACRPADMQAGRVPHGLEWPAGLLSVDASMRQQWPAALFSCHSATCWLAPHRHAAARSFTHSHVVVRATPVGRIGSPSRYALHAVA